MRRIRTVRRDGHAGTLVIGLLLFHLIFNLSGRGQTNSPGALTAGFVNNCDFCLAAQGISPLEAGSSGVRVDLRYLHVGTPYLNGGKIANTDNELETHFTQQYSIFYALAPRFTLAGLIPVAKRHSEVLGDGGSPVTGNQFGLADVSLLVRYKPLESHTMTATTMVSVAAGMKLPTGRTNGVDSRGNLLDAHIQLGTGSTDYLAGVSGFLAWERAALIGNLLGAITGKGANGHRFGDNLNYDVALRYKIYPAEFGGTQIFATLGFNGEWRGREVQDGIADANSGGNVTYIAPGLQLFITPAISFEASYNYALLHGLHGQQLGEDYRILTGVQFLL